MANTSNKQLSSDDTSPPIKTTTIEPHKRRRVTRLCDECRRKKVKCDGQQPCIHCTVYSYECTYNQPSSRKRPSTGGHQIQQSNYQSSSSSSKLTTTTTSQQVQKISHPHNHTELQQQIEENSIPKLLQLYQDFVEKLLPDLKKNINIFKLINVLNQLKNDDSIKKRGIVELSDIINVYKSTTRTNNGVPYTFSPSLSPINNGIINSTTTTTITSGYQPTAAAIDGSFESLVGREIKIILPPKDIAVKLISSTWDNACVLFRFYHRPSFIKQLTILYETDPSNYTDTQQKFLPLVYSVMACGSLFCKSAQFNDSNNNNNKTNSNNKTLENDIFNDEGYKYFIAARKLVDITDTRDIYGIQTIVMLVIFLQCGARLSTCYSYVGIGLRAALREGFHRKLNYPFNPIQLEVRKRIFYTMLKMDIYVNTMLGLPFSLNESDYDQDLPIELDDENITESGYNFNNQNGLSSSAIANSHTKLLMIMKKVAVQLYPLNKDVTLSHIKSNNIVYKLELDLQNWVNELPLELKPGIEPNQRFYKANLLLHFSYLHIKIILYRPFIHYVSQDTKLMTNIDELKSVEKLKNCINIARIVVKLSEDMISKNMLSGSYWFSIYTIFFSVACLVYYVQFGPQLVDDEYLAIKKDAENGKRVLEALKNSSNAARRTFSILNSVFAQLNRKTALENGANHKNEENIPKQQEQQLINVSKAINVPPPPSTDQTAVKFEKNSIDDTSNNNNNNNNNIGSDDGFMNGIDDDRDLARNMTKPTSLKQESPQSSILQDDANNNKNNDKNNNNNMDFNQSIEFNTTMTNPEDNYLPEMLDGFDARIFGKMLPSYMNADFNQVTKDLGNEILPNDEFNYEIPVSLIPQQPIVGGNTSGVIPIGDKNLNDDPFTGSHNSTGTVDEINDQNEYNFDELLNEWAHDGAELSKVNLD